MNAARDTLFPVTMTLEEIRGLVQSDLESVNRVIRARLKSSVPLVDQIADHIIAGGGKRLRPLLVVLVGALMGYEMLSTMWGYQQPRKPTAPLIRGIASQFDMELRDQ